MLSKTKHIFNKEIIQYGTSTIKLVVVKDEIPGYLPLKSKGRKIPKHVALLLDCKESGTQIFVPFISKEKFFIGKQEYSCFPIKDSKFISGFMYMNKFFIGLSKCLENYCKFGSAQEDIQMILNQVENKENFFSSLKMAFIHLSNCAKNGDFTLLIQNDIQGNFSKLNLTNRDEILKIHDKELLNNSEIIKSEFFSKCESYKYFIYDEKNKNILTSLNDILQIITKNSSIKYISEQSEKLSDSILNLAFKNLEDLNEEYLNIIIQGMWDEISVGIHKIEDSI